MTGWCRTSALSSQPRSLGPFDPEAPGRRLRVWIPRGSHGDGVFLGSAVEDASWASIQIEVDLSAVFGRKLGETSFLTGQSRGFDQCLTVSATCFFNDMPGSGSGHHVWQRCLG